MATRTLVEPGWDREVEVAPGVVLLHYPADHASYPDQWAVRHACPGIWRDDEADVIVSAPIVASHEVQSDPLTISPSILCLGGGRECGLHGFVTDGVWVEAGTPEATLRHVRDNA